MVGDAQNARDMGMGMPKTRGCPYHCDSGVVANNDAIEHMSVRPVVNKDPLNNGIMGICREI